MDIFLKKNFSLISFIFIPIFYLWDPNWLELMGTQPYWPLFWLLPWSMIHGSVNGVIVGLFLGLTFDAISLDSSFTQIPGLVLCGLWFGKLDYCSNSLVRHFRHGLICCFGSFLCGILYFLQILVNNWQDNTIFLYFPSLKNIFAQAYVTGLLAPLFCTLLLRLFKSSQERKILINLSKK